jgi:hypothetical protein
VEGWYSVIEMIGKLVLPENAAYIGQLSLFSEWRGESKEVINFAAKIKAPSGQEQTIFDSVTIPNGRHSIKHCSILRKVKIAEAGDYVLTIATEKKVHFSSQFFVERV